MTDSQHDADTHKQSVTNLALLRTCKYIRREAGGIYFSDMHLQVTLHSYSDIRQDAAGILKFQTWPLDRLGSDMR